MWERPNQGRSRFWPYSRPQEKPRKGTGSELPRKAQEISNQGQSFPQDTAPGPTEPGTGEAVESPSPCPEISLHHRGGNPERTTGKERTKNRQENQGQRKTQPQTMKGLCKGKEGDRERVSADTLHRGPFRSFTTCGSTRPGIAERYKGQGPGVSTASPVTTLPLINGPRKAHRTRAEDYTTQDHKHSHSPARLHQGATRTESGVHPGAGQSFPGRPTASPRESATRKGTAYHLEGNTHSVKSGVPEPGPEEGRKSP